MNKAAKGRRREYQAIKQLKSKGFYCMRSAASKGIFDIFAVKLKSDWLMGDRRQYHGIIRCIQVKANKPPSKKELEEIKAFPPHGGIISREIWVYKDGDKEPSIQRV